MKRVQLRSRIVQAILGVAGGLPLVQFSKFLPGLVVLVQVVKGPSAQHSQALVLPCDTGSPVEGCQGFTILSVLELLDGRIGELSSLRRTTSTTTTVTIATTDGFAALACPTLKIGRASCRERV